MINRESYLSQLIKLRDQDLIKVVTGIRRSGKSTLLMAFRQYLYANGVQNNAVLSLNFEERESARFASWEEVYDYIIAHLPNIPKRYVFLDEVQILPHFEKLVDALYVKKDVDLYITGSNAYASLPLRKIKDTYPKYLLTTDFDSANIDGIRKINVIDWLLGKEKIKRQLTTVKRLRRTYSLKPR